ncbi:MULTISPECIES: thioredoxin family protein [Butyricimonas]|jgi:thiol-disulfide isomerase/thioredoxin|uniref:DUF255 domain-containing protein n=1 Tax=Butyricimonas virosa TaxID=544645 RepID=A0A415QDC1_9BACT|nr:MULTISPECIES: thioredoxin family protein [Butyricimonas]MBS5625624.1 DUF255 domain-containing protein [Porphyromonadaceae bacterium]MBR5462163.1 DUF255 domain-containing protein [Butyricimonas sp.]RHM40223.1 DUF255 domain-containing protein [Butyricimonas virosa]HAM85483.1 hypothetical protein [Butyricimonas sp.]HCH91114.1 hypothetical protein [Butyricimonas sp.]
MKKIILFLSVSLFALSLVAQTNFRDITYKEALAAAKAEKKLVFIDFYTSWCGPCKMMMKNIFPLKEVGNYLNSKFVCIKIDAEKGEGPELAKRYQVKAYPTFVAINPAEEILMTKVGGSGSGSGFIGSIDRLIDPDKTPERMKQRYESGERTADLISAYAGLKMEEVYKNRQPDMTKKDEAFKMVQDYFDGLKDKERLAEENVFIYTTYTESPADAIVRYMIANRDKFAPAIKNDISDRIKELYKIDVLNYLTARIPFNQQQYDIVKKGVMDLGLNRDDYYTTAFRFIESYSKGDMDAFMTLCEKEYDQLNDDYKSSLMYSFADVFANADEAVKKRAAKFIRHSFLDMDATMIMFVAQQLMQLEGKGY